MVFISLQYEYMCLIILLSIHSTISTSYPSSISKTLSNTINIVQKVETNCKGLSCNKCPISNFLLKIQFAIMQLHNLWVQLCPFDDVLVYYQMLFTSFYWLLWSVYKDNINNRFHIYYGRRGILRSLIVNELVIYAPTAVVIRKWYFT